MNQRGPLPEPVWTGVFDVAGVELRCHVLSDGVRVIEEGSLAELCEALTTPGRLADAYEELMEVQAWAKAAGGEYGIGVSVP